MLGKCKLCLLDGVDLQDSHYLSVGIYRRLRDESQKNPNPWLLTKTATVQKTRPLKAPLLCHGCELRLSRGGENWVLSRCLQKDGSFPLATTLASRNPNLSSPENPTRIYCAAGIPEINVFALVYFAASIFWRGSIYPWNDDGSVPVELGPFREHFRRYLMGLESFPNDACVWLVVREGEINRLTYAPVGARLDTIHTYKFPMPGLAFTLIVGKNIPAGHREKCLVRGPGNPIFVTTILEESLKEDALRMLQRSSAFAAKRVRKQNG